MLLQKTMDNTIDENKHNFNDKIYASSVNENKYSFINKTECNFNDKNEFKFYRQKLVHFFPLNYALCFVVWPANSKIFIINSIHIKSTWLDSQETA